MGTLCPHCGLENTAGRTICKRCREPLGANPGTLPRPASAASDTPVPHVVARPFLAIACAEHQQWPWPAAARFWLAWVLATGLSGDILGMTHQVGACGGFLLSIANSLVLLCGGVLIGGTQWLVLRRVAAHSSAWVVVSILGWVLAYGIASSVSGSLVGWLGAEREVFTQLSPAMTHAARRADAPPALWRRAVVCAPAFPRHHMAGASRRAQPGHRHTRPCGGS